MVGRVHSKSWVLRARTNYDSPVVILDLYRELLLHWVMQFSLYLKFIHLFVPEFQGIKACMLYNRG